MALVDITNSTVENNVDINTTENTQTIDVIQEPDQTIGIESLESNQDVLVVQEENQQDIKVDLPTGGVGLRGYSAYEIAVQNGFKGTEQEWLKSLEGEDGSTPYIQDGYWYIDGVNTTIKAEGKDGVSVSITKTSSVVVSGEKRTTVEFSDGTSITIHDGKNGADGTDGTSVTIISISESPDDDGKNIIVFSDGSTMSVKNGSRGDKGEKGDGFSISKTYTSIAEMNQGFNTDGVPINGFVLINTGNIQDEDNAKLFVKLAGGYSYLIDLSGAQGIKGDKGDRGDKGDTYTLNEDDINNIAQEAANKIDVESFQRKEDNLLETNSQEVVRGINELLSNIVGDRTWVFDDNLNGAPDFVAEFNFSVLFPTGNIGYFDKMEGYTTNGQYTLRYYGNGGIVPVYEGIWKFPQHQTIIAKTVPDVVKDIATLQVYNVDELLNTNAQTIYGALNELLSKYEEASEELEKIELDTVGRCWVLKEIDLTVPNNTPLIYSFNFTSNGQSFNEIKYYYYAPYEYRLVFNYYDSGKLENTAFVYEYKGDGSSGDGIWQNESYRTIITDDLDINLSKIAEEKPSSLKDRLPTAAKTLAGAIIEVDKRIDEANSNLNSNVEQTTIGQWITGFVGDAANFITALIDKIKEAIKTEKIETLETEEKIVPFAVNEVNRKVKDVVEGRTKVTASTTDKLIAARKITFSGDVSGELSFDGSKDESVEITIIGGKCSNLTGTTWRIPAGWKATAGYGSYFLKYKATAGEDVYNSEQSLQIGSTFVKTYAVGGVALPTDQEDSILFVLGAGQYIPIDSTQEFTLEITGGSGATNTDLIDWLYKYGELESPYQTKVDENLETESKEIVGAINELNSKIPKESIVGTWKLNEAIAPSPKDFGVHFTNNGEEYYVMEFGQDGALYYSVEMTDYSMEVYDNNGWLDDLYRTIEILEEPTDAEFITWLKANGTKQLVDLSNLATVDKVTNFNFASGNCSEVGINSDGKGVEWKNDELEIELAPDNEGNVNYHYAQVYERIPIVAGDNIDFEVDEENQVVKINAEVDTSNLATVDKVKSIDTWSEGVSELTADDGISWREGFIFYDDTALSGNEIARGDIHHRMPIVAGENINFEATEDGQYVKINATGGGSPDNVILKYTVELTGSEMVTDIINQLRGKGYQLGTFGFVEFSGATSGLYGLTINHYGGNVYNIGGIDFGTFYTMANNVTDWSTVSIWPFLSMFQPPIPYCDDSNNGQVLKVVNGVPTWTNL